MALEQLESEFGPDVFAYVELHVVQGLATPTGVQRWHDYGTVGTPTIFFDGGGDFVTGGGAVGDLYTAYRARIESHAATPPLVTIDGDLTLDTGTEEGALAITLGEIVGMTISNPEECVVRVHVYEDDVFFCCGIGGRDMWGRVSRVVLEGGALAFGTTALDFPLDASWDVANLRAIAFVQRGLTGEVLNAARVNVTVTTAVEGSSWGRIKALFRE